jgi:peptide/nickel transport system permease protein
VTGGLVVSPMPALRARRRRARWGVVDWVATVLLLAVLVVALAGPTLAPHSPYALAGIPYSGPSAGHLLGLDDLGRDVLSRVLAGGRTVVLLALFATLAAYVVGGSAGLFAGYSRSLVDPLIMRVTDVVLAFPPILFLLVVATGAPHSQVALAIALTIVQAPGVARIMRTATLEASVRGYVEAAAARGESLLYVLFREILPNIRGVIVADAGPRFTVSILAVAALNFLGLGQRPPAPNWALMINENQGGLTANPWAVLAPAIMIAVLTISLNIVADGLNRRRQGAS